MKLFELYATLGLDTSDFDKGVQNSAKKADELGENIEKSVGTKAVFMGNMLTDITKSVVSTLTRVGIESFNVGAEIEAANAQFAAAFGDLQSEATDAFNAIGEQTNILPTRLQEVGTKGFSQLEGSGLEANEALEQSQKLLTLAADAAAYYDITLEAADERLRSFMRGNTEAGDAIGLFTSEAQRDKAALEEYDQKWGDLTESQRQMLMLGIAEEIYTQSGAIGQAAREGDSWTNVLANVGESWRQIVGAFGQPLTDSFTPILEKMTEFLLANKEKVDELAASVAEFVEGALDKAIAGYQWCLDNQETLGTVLSVIAVGFAAIWAAVNPIGALIAAITSAVVAMVVKWEEIESAAITVWNNITGAIQSAINAIKSFLGLNSEASSVHLSSDGVQHGGGAGGSYVSGLPYVPYDNFGAFLHRGEAVLTRQQAEEYRSGRGGSVDVDALAAAVGAALNGAAVVMDGHAVGQLVTGTVSRQIAREARTNRRYGG